MHGAVPRLVHTPAIIQQCFIKQRDNFAFTLHADAIAEHDTGSLPSSHSAANLLIAVCPVIAQTLLKSSTYIEMCLTFLKGSVNSVWTEELLRQRADRVALICTTHCINQSPYKLVCEHVCLFICYRAGDIRSRHLEPLTS
jgi:hypothetical protein